MLRPNQMQYLTTVEDDGIPVRYFVDFWGRIWKAWDFELARKHDEQQDIPPRPINFVGRKRQVKHD